MLRIIIFIIFVVGSVTGLAQNNLEGVYFSNENSACKVGITDNRFYYVESLPKWTNDTLADFEWKRVNEEFIRVYFPNISYDYNMKINTKIRQSYDSSIVDNCVIFRFSMNNTKNLDVSVSAKYKNEESVSYDFIYSNDNHEIVVPSPVSTFYFSISTPISNIQMHDSLGGYYGSNYFSSLHYEIKSAKINLVEVHIPFDYSYFEKYYTVGEFVRVHNDTLSWKGRTFVKSK